MKLNFTKYTLKKNGWKEKKERNEKINKLHNIGKSYREISIAMKVTIPTVRSVLHRLKLKLGISKGCQACHSKGYGGAGIWTSGNPGGGGGC